MKKTYIIPATLMVAVQQHVVIAASPDVIVNRQGGAAPESFDAKGSQSSYNVWDDDWSK